MTTVLDTKQPVVSFEPVNTISVKISCTNCIYYRTNNGSGNLRLYCSNPIGSANKDWLDMDAVEEKHPDVPEKELEAIGWAEQCSGFIATTQEVSGEEEYLPDIDTAAADAGWEPF